MKKAKVLKEQRGKLKSNIRAMIEKAKAEQRELTTEEETQFDEWKAEIEELDTKIERAEAIEKEEREAAFEAAQQRGDVRHFNRRNDEGGENGEKKKLKKQYSIVRAIRLASENRQLDGVEREMHEQAVQEAHSIGKSVGGVGIPAMMFERAEQRATLTVGTAATAGDLVDTELSNELIGALRPRLMVEQMGARILTGLTSNIDIPRQTDISNAQWEGEITEAQETNPAVDKINLSPKRLAAFTEYGKQLLAQSNISVERMVREDLEFAIRQALDYAAINGSGTGNVPRGILNYAGIGSVGGAAAVAPTRDHIIDLESAIAIQNADMGNLAYLTTPGIRGQLKKTKTDAGSGIFVWQGQDLNGYTARVSTQVPSDLSDGAANDLHAILYGNWNDLILANWAGIDLVVDPYTKAKNAVCVVTINSWWDINIRHAESFAAMKVAQVS